MQNIFRKEKDDTYMIAWHDSKIVQYQVYTLAFDVYGTLVDTNGILIALERLVNIHATLFMNTWRGK